MNCYICEKTAVGMCGQCSRFYCYRHAGRPTGGEKARCKVCSIGAQNEERSKEAESLVEEILAGYGMTLQFQEAPSGEAVLSEDQSARLLDSLLFILSNSPNCWARRQVAHALFDLARMHPLVERESRLNRPATRAAFGLVSALDDQEYWVRFDVADTLLRAECSECISPIVRLWRAKDIDAFPSNVIEHLERWAKSDDNIKALLQSVMDGLGMKVL